MFDPFYPHVFNDSGSRYLDDYAGLCRLNTLAGPFQLSLKSFTNQNLMDFAKG